MTDLPFPLTPSDCDLRGYNWMPLLGHRLFNSSWYRSARKDGRGGIAAIKLWWTAMLQMPAGSLPNDEEELCMLADFGEDMRAWKRHRAVAMHGFILCNDNRWYHPVVCEQAMKAMESRTKAQHARQATAERVRRHRASRNGQEPPPGNGVETPHDTQDVTQQVTRYNEPSNELRNAFSAPDKRDKTRQEKEGGAHAPLVRARTTPPGKRWELLGEGWEPQAKSRLLAATMGFDERRLLAEANRFAAWATDKKVTSRDWEGRFCQWLTHEKNLELKRQPRSTFDTIREKLGGKSFLIPGSMEPATEPTRLKAIPGGKA